MRVARDKESAMYAIGPGKEEMKKLKENVYPLKNNMISFENIQKSARRVFKSCVGAGVPKKIKQQQSLKSRPPRKCLGRSKEVLRVLVHSCCYLCL